MPTMGESGAPKRFGLAAGFTTVTRAKTDKPAGQNSGSNPETQDQQFRDSPVNSTC